MATDKKDAKIKAKREKLKALGNGFGSNEPILDPSDYTASLMRALNFYNASNDNKEKRKWFMSYVGKGSKEFDTLSDFDFRSIGTIIRLKQREQPLEDKELKFIDDTIQELRNKAKEEIRAKSTLVQRADTQTQSVVPKPTIQDRIAEAASNHIAEFNAMFDEYFVNDVEPNFAAYLNANNVSGAVAKLIPPAFVSMWNEMQELIEGTDKQLNEGYAFLKKTKVKKICKLIEELENACAQRAVVAKVARKPRARKEKPAAVLANKVKYMKEFAELDLKSERPEKIVGASEVVVYNTKYKKLQIYRAFGEGTLSVKGTTITNYDVATSGSKTLRKPEIMKEVAAMSKRTFSTTFKALKTKESAVNGRLNEDCIIVKVY